MSTLKSKSSCINLARNFYPTNRNRTEFRCCFHFLLIVFQSEEVAVLLKASVYPALYTP